MSLSKSLRDTTSRLAELGWLHNKIRKYTDQRSLDRAFGLVGQVGPLKTLDVATVFWSYFLRNYWVKCKTRMMGKLQRVHGLDHSSFNLFILWTATVGVGQRLKAKGCCRKVSCKESFFFLISLFYWSVYACLQTKTLLKWDDGVSELIALSVVQVTYEETLLSCQLMLTVMC